MDWAGWPVIEPGDFLFNRPIIFMRVEFCYEGEMRVGVYRWIK